jgi:hypothetical protein
LEAANCIRQRQSEQDASILSNCYTRICFRLGDTDAERFASGFSVKHRKKVLSVITRVAGVGGKHLPTKPETVKNLVNYKKGILWRTCLSFWLSKVNERINFGKSKELLIKTAYKETNKETRVKRKYPKL